MSDLSRLDATIAAPREDLLGAGFGERIPPPDLFKVRRTQDPVVAKTALPSTPLAQPIASDCSVTDRWLLECAMNDQIPVHFIDTLVFRKLIVPKIGQLVSTLKKNQELMLKANPFMTAAFEALANSCDPRNEKEILAINEMLFTNLDTLIVREGLARTSPRVAEVLEPTHLDAAEVYSF